MRADRPRGRPAHAVLRRDGARFDLPRAARVARVATPNEPKSGFHVLDRGEEALLWRGALTDRAERSIDAQYFIWSEDNVGTIAAERLLRAADRGVRVRVLVDDLSLSPPTRASWRCSTQHPRIEIRIYNPDRRRWPAFLPKVFAFGPISSDEPAMHNKALVIDGAVAVIGGRNIADEYFDMHSEYNFRDRDVVAVGPGRRPAGARLRPLLEQRLGGAGGGVRPRRTSRRPSATPTTRGCMPMPSTRNTFPNDSRGRWAEMDARSHDLAGRLVWGEARVSTTSGQERRPRALNAFGEMGRSSPTPPPRAKSGDPGRNSLSRDDAGHARRLLRDLRSEASACRILTNSLASTDEPSRSRATRCSASAAPARCRAPRVDATSASTLARSSPDCPRMAVAEPTRAAREDDGDRPAHRLHRLVQHGSALDAPQHRSGRADRQPRARAQDRCHHRARHGPANSWTVTLAPRRRQAHVDMGPGRSARTATGTRGDAGSCCSSSFSTDSHRLPDLMRAKGVAVLGSPRLMTGSVAALSAPAFRRPSRPSARVPRRPLGCRPAAADSVRRAIAAYFGVEVDDITDGTDLLRDLHADPMEAYEIVAMLCREQASSSPRGTICPPSGRS